MLFTKVIKYRKLIICVVFLLGVAIYMINMKTGSHIDVPQAKEIAHLSGLSYVKTAGIIDKDLVVKSLHSAHQLVGMEGHATNAYVYHDSWFQDNNWLKDMIGRRTITMDIHAYFKFGIDLADIHPEDISVYGNTLFVKIPKQVLISLDIPYDQIILKTKTGIMRTVLDDSDKQSIYAEIRRLTLDKLTNDPSITDKSYNGVKEALQTLLEKVPNLNRIIFTKGQV